MVVAETLEYRIDLEGPLVVVRSAAGWSVGVARRYAETMDALVVQLVPRWGVLALVEGVPILGPDGEAVMAASVKHRRTLGLTALAMIVPHGLGESISRWQMTRIYRDAGVELAWFDDEASARAWIQPLLSAA